MQRKIKQKLKGNMKQSDTQNAAFRETFLKMIDNQENPFHPLVFVQGEPEVGKNVYIGLFSEINARGSRVVIGDNCDIASFVSINVADSHKKCIGLADENERKPITIENNVFIGSHCFVKGGAHIGHHSVIAAGTIVEGVVIPPYSVISGNPMKVKKGYYKRKLQEP
jgi:acetyltransferase-like isoleucine patch superfamily enzyme